MMISAQFHVSFDFDLVTCFIEDSEHDGNFILLLPTAEIWNNKPYDSTADIWALGCLIYEVSITKHISRNETYKKCNIILFSTSHVKIITDRNDNISFYDSLHR